MEGDEGEPPRITSRNGRHINNRANGHEQEAQMSLFAASTATVEAIQVANPLVEELSALSVMELTPLEAITKLYELQQKARQLKELDSK